MTTSNRLFGNNSKIYMATPQRPIFWLLDIIQSFCYCACHKYLSTANRHFISNLEYCLHIWLLCVQKLYDNFKSPIWKHFSDLYGYCAKPNILDTAHLYFSTASIPIIYLLQIEQLFQNWK